jgi:NADH-quinone oxidoreductase subunit A
MLNTYIPVLVLAVLAAVLAVGMVVLSFLLGPKRPDARKVSTYECGVTPVGSARERFPVKFFLVAMLFIIFDVETIFLYPWAVTFKDAPKAVQLFNLSRWVCLSPSCLWAISTCWARAHWNGRNRSGHSRVA